MDPQRHARLEALGQILTTQAVGNQADLVRLLKRGGHAVTQSSVSRDLRELGAIRTADGYRLPGVVEASHGGPVDREIFRSLVIGVDSAGPNLLVLRTAIGGASRVGLAADRASLPGVVGSVAGDDTLFLAVKTLKDRRRLERLLAEWMAA
ncbi:MAG: arginine repressor [Planctomycetes bacterium]|nr:arginine repressor [Planctomycetota bacterium]MCB9913010.1 arginine repressor [Planctomycetota bacterium]HPF12670.1 arginine repressor [Planctomycetota bacterium]HRV81943.1 arginine repressor [Planctomycetota bacterium]